MRAALRLQGSSLGELIHTADPCARLWATACASDLLSSGPTPRGPRGPQTSTSAYWPQETAARVQSKCHLWSALPWRRVVHVQQRLVEIGQVKVILCFIILRKSFILRGRKFTQGGKISIHVSNIKSMRLIKIAVSKKQKQFPWLSGLNQLFSKHKLFLIWKCKLWF